MATERQLRLAQLLADGVDGVEAAITAGWPETTARWLGLNARAYLEGAGIGIPAPSAPVKPRPTKTDPTPAPSALPVAETPAEHAESVTVQADVATEPNAPTVARRRKDGNA